MKKLNRNKYSEAKSIDLKFYKIPGSRDCHFFYSKLNGKPPGFGIPGYTIKKSTLCTLLG